MASPLPVEIEGRVVKELSESCSPGVKKCVLLPWPRMAAHDRSSDTRSAHTCCMHVYARARTRAGTVHIGAQEKHTTEAVSLSLTSGSGVDNIREGCKVERVAGSR
mmetsp:Transcript_18950/g.39924  ORF Transcript_18950/g.39924 Transcript_18950/m.39924 type:complete len:106 (-) Transcript_18950:159-476(-)